MGAGARFTDFTATTRFELSDGDWVDFRTELSFSEQSAVESGVLTSKVDQTTREIDVAVVWADYEIIRLAAWITGWSFIDEDGVTVPATRETIRKLTPETAAELSGALDAHLSSQAGDEGKGGNVELS